MINLLIGIAIGLVVGFHFPQYKLGQRIWNYVKGLVIKK